MGVELGSFVGSQKMPHWRVGIGYVTRTDKDFKGNLKTLSIKAPIEIASNANKSAEKQPDYLIFVEGAEVGAAWNRVSNTSGNEYVSLQLAAPEWPTERRRVGTDRCWQARARPGSGRPFMQYERRQVARR